MAKSFIILFMAIIFISQIGCKSGRRSEHKEVKEFEGVITYHEMDNTIEGMNVDDTVTVYYIRRQNSF